MNIEPVVLDTPEGISFFRFASLKQQFKLEKLGLRHSRGALRPRLAAEFGLKARDSHDKYIAYCEAQMQALETKVKGQTK